MTFLALAPWQVWTLAVATAAIVAGLFFLKTRHPRVLVGSLVLWRRVLEEYRPDSLIERLRRAVSLIVALVIALAIAFALGQPARKGAGAGPAHLTIVLDSSVSMLTRLSGGDTRWDRAVSLARDIIANAGATSTFTLVDTTSTTRAVTVDTRADAFEALKTFTVGAKAGRFPTVDRGDELVFISDGVSPRNVPEGVTRRSVFEAAKNVGVTAFEVRPIPASTLAHEVFIEVVNASSEPADVSLSIDVGKRRLLAQPLTLGAGEVHHETARIPPGIGGLLHARATTDDDAFPLDDDAYAVVAEQQRLRVGLVTVGNEFLSAALGADPHVSLSAIVSGAYTGKEDVDAYVFDRFAPASAPQRPALYFAPSPRAWLGTPAAEIGDRALLPTEPDHPLLQFVSLADVRVKRATPIDGDSWRGIVSAGDAPIVVVRESPTRAAVVAFDLEASDFSTQLAFPIFLQNAVRWLGGDDIVPNQPLGLVRLPWTNMKVSLHDGHEIPVSTVLNGSVFDAKEPGVYEAVTPSMTHRIAANLTSTALSNVNATTFDTMSTKAESGGALIKTDWWRTLVVVALALAALEWWSYHRRVTV